MCRPSDTNPEYMRRSGAGPHGLRFRLVAETHAELVVDSPPVLDRDTGKGLSEITELVDQCLNLELAHPVCGRSMVDAMLLGGLRRCEVLGLRQRHIRWGERRLFIANGKGGHQRIVPISAPSPIADSIPQRNSAG